jgi:hypothetical protein
MILAILADTSKTESLLNNLSEADFDLDDVSVIMQDIGLRDKIARDGGPLRKVDVDGLPSNLKKAGIAAELAERGSDAVKKGKVLVAMTVDPKYEQAARQMFQDMSAEILS